MNELGKALDIGRINILRLVRDRSNLFFVFVLPLIIVVALGLQFGSGSNARVGVVSPTGDADAEAIVAGLEAADAQFDVRRLADEATLLGQVERGLLEAGILIPEGYGAALRGGGTAEVRYVGTNDALTLGLRAPIEAVVARQATIATAARSATGTAGGSLDEALEAAEAGYDEVPGVGVEVVRAGEASVFEGFTQFTFGAQTQLILFTFLTSMTGAGYLVLSRKLGVSRRMISTPTPMWVVVVGEALGRYGTALVQALLIVAVTSLVFGVQWGDPLAAGLIIALFALASAGIAMIVGAVATNADQAGALGVVAGLVVGAIGGAMIPLAFMPDVMQTVAQATPHMWAITGLQSLVSDGGGVGSVAQNLLVLAGFGAVSMAIASWRLRVALTR